MRKVSLLGERLDINIICKGVRLIERADQEYLMKKKYSPELRQHIREPEGGKEYVENLHEGKKQGIRAAAKRSQVKIGTPDSVDQPVVTLWKFARGERQVVDSIYRSCS